MNENTNETDDSLKNIGEDKTFSNELDGIPGEDDALGTDESKSGDDKKSDSDKPDRAEIAQKIKYREKFLKAQQQIRGLESEIESLKKRNEPTGQEEKELNAQRYIREQARKEYENILAEQKAAQERAEEALQEKIDAVLEDNPDLTEEQLSETCEEYGVEPKIAAKILAKQTKEPKKKKPSLPKPKQATDEVAATESPSNKEPAKRKSIYDLAQEVKASLRKSL